MRRICLILLVTALAAPAAAIAGDRMLSTAGDGSLVATAVNGTVIVQGRGLIFGHVDQGVVIVIDYRPDEPSTSLTVTGAKGKLVHAGAAYSGGDVRFLFPSGRYTIQLTGLGISASAVGKGSVSVTGAGTADDGSYTVNGGKPQAVAKSSAGQTFGGGFGGGFGGKSS